MLRLKFLLASALFAFAITLPAVIHAQTDMPQANIAYAPSMEQNDFLGLVERVTKLLQTTPVNEIPDEEHVIIIRCLNTISIHELKAPACLKLETVAEELSYSNKLIEKFTDWIPNRGMGYYFPSLHIELHGTPGPGSYYHIFSVNQ